MENVRARQCPLVAVVKVALADLANGAYTAVVDVPPGATVLSGAFVVTTLFNSGTTDQFSIGHKVGSAAAVDTYYAAQSADVTTAPTRVPVVPTGAFYAVKSSVGVRWDGAGTAATAGEGYLIVEYAVEGRAEEVQP